jgi:hypothetical protein
MLPDHISETVSKFKRMSHGLHRPIHVIRGSFFPWGYCTGSIFSTAPSFSSVRTYSSSSGPCRMSRTR